MRDSKSPWNFAVSIVVAALVILPVWVSGRSQGAGPSSSHDQRSLLPRPHPPSLRTVTSEFGQLPLVFEENRGQINQRVRFWREEPEPACF